MCGWRYRRRSIRAIARAPETAAAKLILRNQRIGNCLLPDGPGVGRRLVSLPVLLGLLPYDPSSEATRRPRVDVSLLEVDAAVAA